MPFIFTEYICYDDGCHLRKYTQNSKRKDLTVTSQKLASLSIYVDKLHIKGHTDPWCLENCDARNVEDLNDVSCNHSKKVEMQQYIDILPYHNRVLIHI